ncbi:MAG TPA: tryptophan synthase subunit alpha [Kofleriaceae bacterium]|nr:tryptophan synthase subunit alpha [Kofleriaceae bacterium]
MSRLRNVMRRCAEEQRAALIIYVTHGDPSPAESADVVIGAAEAGADVIELGVPFSDPNADGVVIQEAMQRALAAGSGLVPALETVAEVRRRGCEVPVVLFGYYNPIFVHGVERFATDACAAGVDAVLTVDLPIDELAELQGPLAARGLDVVPLVAPTSTDARITRVRELDPPFVYYISMTGITGASIAGASVGPERVAQVQHLTGAPVAVGFGIKTADDVRRVAAYADGVVVGSAVVRCIAEAGPGRAAAAVAGLLTELRAGIARR